MLAARNFALWRQLRLKFGSGTALALYRSNGGEQPPAAPLKTRKAFP